MSRIRNHKGSFRAGSLNARLVEFFTLNPDEELTYADIGAIAAVQPITDGRLMFYMRDRRMLAAGLNAAINSDDPAALARNSFAGSFLPPEATARHPAAIDLSMARF